MSYLARKKEITAGQIAPVYFLYGTESFLIEDIIQNILTRTLTKDEMDMNLSVYSLTETSVELIVEEAETIPFFGAKRVILLKDVYIVSSQRHESKIDHDLKKLEQYLENPVPETVLVMIAPYEKLDERKKLTKQLKKLAAVVEAFPFDEKETARWLTLQAQERKVELTETGKERLIQLLDNRLMLLASELEKMALYVGERGTIDEQVVDKLVSRTLDQDVFSLIDHAVKGSIQEALYIYHDLLKQKEDPLKLLALLGRQFRILYQVKELSRRGYAPKQMASQLKLHPYVVKLAIQQTKQFSEHILLKLLERTADTDYLIKSGANEKTLAVELLLLTIVDVIREEKVSSSKGML